MLSRSLILLCHLSLFLNPNLSFGASALGISSSLENDIENGNLTDQEKQTADSYFHVGHNNRILEEACAENKETKEACQGIDPSKTKGMGIDPMFGQAAAQAYSLVLGFTGASGGLTTRGDYKEVDGEKVFKNDKFGKENEAFSSVENKNEPVTKDEKQSDYCAMIGGIGHTLSSFMQQMSNDNIQAQSKDENSQRASLLLAARSYEDKADQAKMSFQIWGATSMCYTAMMAQPHVAIDWKIGLKAAGSFLLTAYFKDLEKTNKYYAGKARGVASKLPGAGDCNPITDRLCYCAEPTTKNDPNYCLKEKTHNLLSSDLNDPIACVNVLGTVDPDCQCKISNTCKKGQIEAGLAASGISSNYLRSMPFNTITNGELLGSASAGGVDSNISSALKKYNKYANKIPLNASINGSNTAFKKMTEELGLSPKASVALLNSPKASKAALSALGAIPGNRYGSSNYKRISGRYGKKKSNVAYKKNRSGLRKVTSNSGRKPASRSSGSRGGVNVLKFAERAQAKAEIHKDTGRPLFEILSRRYMLSGWKKLK